MTKLLTFLIIHVIFFFVFIQTTFAQDWNSIVPNCVTNDGIPTLQCIPAVFRNVVNAALTFVGLTALIMIIYSGIKFINSHGDAKQVEGAKNTFTYAIMGLVLVLLSFLIINLISYITKVDCINKFGFNNCQ